MRTEHVSKEQDITLKKKRVDRLRSEPNNFYK